MDKDVNTGRGSSFPYQPSLLSTKSVSELLNMLSHDIDEEKYQLTPTLEKWGAKQISTMLSHALALPGRDTTLNMYTEQELLNMIKQGGYCITLLDKSEEVSENVKGFVALKPHQDESAHTFYEITALIKQEQFEEKPGGKRLGVWLPEAIHFLTSYQLPIFARTTNPYQIKANQALMDKFGNKLYHVYSSLSAFDKSYPKFFGGAVYPDMSPEIIQSSPGKVFINNPMQSYLDFYFGRGSAKF